MTKYLRKVQWQWATVFVGVGFLAFSIYLLYSNNRYKVCHQLPFCSKQALLSVIQGDISGNGDYFKVMKFKTKTGINIKFIKETKRGARKIVKDVLIPHPYNGFFEHRGQAIQLGMSDVNGDGIMEILAPSFDKNLEAYLNAYSYDTRRETFERMGLSHSSL